MNNLHEIWIPFTTILIFGCQSKRKKRNKILLKTLLPQVSNHPVTEKSFIANRNERHLEKSCAKFFISVATPTQINANYVHTYVSTSIPAYIRIHMYICMYVKSYQARRRYVHWEVAPDISAVVFIAVITCFAISVNLWALQFSKNSLLELF